MSTESHSNEVCRENLEDLPPSAKLILKTLQYEGSLTQQEIIEETDLTARTVRYATNQLEEEGVVTSRVNFSDARQNVYSVVATLQRESTPRRQ